METSNAINTMNTIVAVIQISFSIIPVHFI